MKRRSTDELQAIVGRMPTTRDEDWKYTDLARARDISSRWLNAGADAPSATLSKEIDRIIFDELVKGIFTPQAIGYFQRTIERLEQAGCDAVILGCTEIPLIIDDANSPLPTLDSTRLIARAALRRALGIEK